MWGGGREDGQKVFWKRDRGAMSFDPLERARAKTGEESSTLCFLLYSSFFQLVLSSDALSNCSLAKSCSSTASYRYPRAADTSPLLHCYSSLLTAVALLFNSISSIEPSSPSSTCCCTACMLHLYSTSSLCAISFLLLLLPVAFS